ncbi:hypothetical protein DLAC_10349 [Tieghemostelium lacteum]|uniref:GH18 domain-containing protein n=1 Tax=Tieghemostelium lacteum TaxID=361077 RepID=A0A151Z5N6_TIELA|nr:hypothetical protein DLAC_10349 [Tieghemostelium lacteum]|eukprot:KYQ89114.1 hypothetical protein DLAC_10349 [Tieghemostelium lacteum]
MPWMGLERTQENITSDLEQIEQYSTFLTAVSFERFNLGSNSQLIVNNFTDVQEPIQSKGLWTLPMVSTCCPWGRPEVIEWVRELAANPQPFINEAIQHALDEGFTGYNLDIEPLNGTSEDAELYSQFLDQFATELHSIGKILTVDVASYTEFWNFTLIASTQVDYLMTMSTYAGTYTGFQQALQYATQTIPLKKLIVGMMTVDDNNQPFTDQELTQRFQLLASYNINQIAIWDSPIPSNWIPFLKTLSTQS